MFFLQFLHWRKNVHPDQQRPGKSRPIRRPCQNANDQVRGTRLRLDFGESPKTLDDLVEKGYLDPSGIVDHKGDKLPFSPEAILPDFTATQSYVTKSCGNCGATVDPNSKAGIGARIAAWCGA